MAKPKKSKSEMMHDENEMPMKKGKKKMPMKKKMPSKKQAGSCS